MSNERSFLSWANKYLHKRKLHAKSTADFDNGLMLLNLLELVSSKAISRHYNFDLRPKTRAAKISNVNSCLEFLSDEGIKFNSNSVAERIVDNEVEVVLSVLWGLIFFYHIYPICPFKKDYCDKLIAWAEKKTKRKLTTDSWISGEAFYYLCQSIRPEIVPARMKHIENDILGNMILIMENNFQIPPGIITKTDFQQYFSEKILMIVLVYLASERIKSFTEERKTNIQHLRTDKYCSLSNLPEELFFNVVSLVSDPLPWLFVNC